MAMMVTTIAMEAKTTISCIDFFSSRTCRLVQINRRHTMQTHGVAELRRIIWDRSHVMSKLQEKSF